MFWSGSRQIPFSFYYSRVIQQGSREREREKILNKKLENRRVGIPGAHALIRPSRLVPTRVLLPETSQDSFAPVGGWLAIAGEHKPSHLLGDMAGGAADPSVQCWLCLSSVGVDLSPPSLFGSAPHSPPHCAVQSQPPFLFL